MSSASSSTPRPGFGSRFAERCLYAVLLATPAYFAVFSERVFEAEKAGLLRWLAACALVGLALQGSRSARSWPRHPIPMAMALLLTTALLSTITSVAPASSLMGAYARGQGLATLAAFLLFALVAARVTAEPGGLRRLSMVIALSGFAPALYGLLQSFGLDPLPWEGDVVTRVVGSAGNSVMLAAHLVLCLPFAVGELARAWGALQERSVGHGAVALAGWLLVAGVEVLAIVLSGSRGPILGLAAGCFVLVLALAAVRARRRVALATTACALFALLSLLLLNFPPGPLAPFLAPAREIPILERFSTALDPERSTTRVRLRLWEGSTAALAAHPERWPLGFGPETMDRIWAPYYPPILAYDEPRGYLPDRAHNLALDALLSGGLLGLVALLGLFGASIAALLRVLGLGADRPKAASAPVARLALAAGLLIAASPLVLSAGWSLAGLALGLGCLAGISIWLLGVAMRPGRSRVDGAADGERRYRWTEHRGFAASALVAVVAHFTELQVGFQLVSSGLLFWVLAGAAEAVRGAAEAGRSVTERSGQHHLARGIGQHDLAQLSALVVGSTLTFSLARPGLVAGGVGAVLFLVLGSGLWVGLLVRSSNGRSAAGSWARDTFSALFGLHRHGAALWLGAYALLHLALLARLRERPDDALFVLAADLLGYALCLLALCIWSARRPAPAGAGRHPPVTGSATSPSNADARPHGAARLARSSANSMSGPRFLLVLGGIAAGLYLFLVPTLADAAYKDGLRAWQAEVAPLRGEGESGQAESFLSRASARYALASRSVPWEPEYRLAAARAQVEWADLLDARLSRRLSAAGMADAPDEYDPALLDGAALSVAAARDARFEAALEHLREAEAWMAPSPLPALTRARSLRVWGDRTRAADRRDRRLREASEAYREAMALAPGWPEVLDEAALTALLADDPTAALAWTRAAIELDPFFRRAWRTSAEAHLALGDPAAAALAYGEYFVDYRNTSDLPALRGWMEALAADGQIEAAIARAREIQRLRPADAGALADLAQLLQSSGDLEAAREAAVAAGALAPEDAAIRRLIEEIEGSNESEGPQY